MKTFLTTILLLICTTLVFAQNTGVNWTDATLINSEIPVVSTTTTFSVEIPNDDVDLTIQALCYSTGSMDSCDGSKANSVVRQFIQEKIAQYQRANAAVKQVDIQG